MLVTGLPPDQSLLPERGNDHLVEGALGFLINHQEVAKSKFFKGSEETEEIIASNDERVYKERMNRARSYNFEPVSMSRTINSILEQHDSTRDLVGSLPASPDSSSRNLNESKASTAGKIYGERFYTPRE